MGDELLNTAAPVIAASRIVVIMPNWLGDGVMATPFLRALRGVYPAAHIAAVARPLVAPVLVGLPYINGTFITKKGEESAACAWLKQNKFDLGILLPNSFRSAWLLWRVGIKRRLGYRRECRGLLLTDRIEPVRKSPAQQDRDRAKAKAIKEIRRNWPRHGHSQMHVVPSSKLPTKYELPDAGGFEPTPTIDYYLKLAEYLGASVQADKRMHLAITDAERSEAEHILNSELGVLDSPLVVIVSGANFGSSKCWPPERFAQLADRLIDPRGEFRATVLLASSPTEMPIIDAILAARVSTGESVTKLHALAKLNNGKGTSLGALKEIVRRSSLMICNDTGPRHFAAALGVPTVTLFGPTDPVWAETYSVREKIVRLDIPCGPCQLKRCPIDHRCMTGLDVQHVFDAAIELWRGNSGTDQTGQRCD